MRHERAAAVLVPVLDRPRLVAPLVSSLHDSTSAERGDGWHVRLVFVCSPEDAREIAAVRAAGLEPLLADWPPGPGDYARKINHAARLAEEPWLFTGADDLRFHPGWLRACVSEHVRTGALVIGTNDLGNPWVMNGRYATHLLVHRDWLARGTIDQPGVIFHEGYDHNCVDTELVETARARRSYAFAKTAHVEHLHPSWRKGVDDSTYAKGRAHHRDDRRLLATRQRLIVRESRRNRNIRTIR